jgi:branched-chain amino acid transport system permease protein
VERLPSEDGLLVVSDLRRDFQGVQAVAGASFSVRRGTITGLIGPNGAGKSTALSMIAGALRPTSGSIAFEGSEIAGLPSHEVARRGVTRTFQISSEFTRLTVLENLLVAAPDQRGERLRGALLGRRYWRSQDRQIVRRSRALLEQFEMSAKENEYAGDLSSGQKRLLEIMRSLMANPTLLLLDEPMAGVNPSLSRRIETYLLTLRDQGLTMLMVEHELSVVERLCDPIVVMAQGKVISQGTMREIRANQEVLDAYLVG